MVAIGCTICRDCQLGTCHVGITTQIESTGAAQAAGLKHFVPRELEDATQALVRLFSIGEGRPGC
jgi:glutamate synthase (NADPH/NADH) large chain